MPHVEFKRGTFIRRELIFRHEIPASEVSSITCRKMNRLTFDEVRLDLIGKRGRMSFCETDRGFWRVIDRIAVEFGFDAKDAVVGIEAGPVGSCAEIWSRDG